MLIYFSRLIHIWSVYPEHTLGVEDMDISPYKSNIFKIIDGKFVIPVWFNNLSWDGFRMQLYSDSHAQIYEKKWWGITIY